MGHFGRRVQDMTTQTAEPTTAASPQPWEPRLDFDSHAPTVAKAMAGLDRAAVVQAERAGLAPSLRELVRLRASQLNGCAYCVDMHAKDARVAGEEDRRLDGLAVWKETPFFCDAERAALDLAEAITCCAEGHVPATVWEAAAEQFSSPQLAALVALVVAVNAWNRIGVTTRCWPPGSYRA
jgi:AhpD family alkylhydroperoxidase